MNLNETILNAKDGTALFTRTWRPDTVAIGTVCLVHGLGEHCGRYHHVADFLNRSGYTVLAFDLRGHGKSGGKRGDTPAFQSYMDDITVLLDKARRDFPGRPRFLYGHSLGGVLVLNYALRLRPRLAGIIATSPGLRTTFEEQHLKLSLVHLLAPLMPGLTLPNGLDVQALSIDPQVILAYQQDDLVHDRASLRLAKESFSAIEWAFEHAAEFSMPLLLIHGTHDRIAYSQGSQLFASQVKSDCTLKLWEGGYHELHNEPERAKVLQFIADWLNNHLTLDKPD